MGRRAVLARPGAQRPDAGGGWRLRPIARRDADAAGIEAEGVKRAARRLAFHSPAHAQMRAPMRTIGVHRARLA